jgi:hypothetical protein
MIKITILICNKKLSIGHKYTLVSYVSSNGEDGSPIHCIHSKPTNKDPHKSIKGFQVHPIAQVPSSSNAKRVSFDYSEKCNYLFDITNFSVAL